MTQNALASITSMYVRRSSGPYPCVRGASDATCDPFLDTTGHDGEGRDSIAQVSRDKSDKEIPVKDDYLSFAPADIAANRATRLLGR
jgi:hypothetical protein